MSLTPEVVVSEVTGRFWEKVDIRGPDDCWQWTAGTDPEGYGHIKIKYVPRRAHRVALVLAGRPPGDLCVLHHCDNPGCVNPNHLYRGTLSDNLKDAWDRGNRNYLRGENAPRAKLSRDEVIEIRRRWREGDQTQRELAEMFDTAQTNVSNIIHGRSWTHLEPARLSGPTDTEDQT